MFILWLCLTFLASKWLFSLTFWIPYFCSTEQVLTSERQGLAALLNMLQAVNWNLLWVQELLRTREDDWNTSCWLRNCRILAAWVKPSDTVLLYFFLLLLSGMCSHLQKKTIFEVWCLTVCISSSVMHPRSSTAPPESKAWSCVLLLGLVWWYSLEGTSLSTLSKWKKSSLNSWCTNQLLSLLMLTK